MLSLICTKQLGESFTWFRKTSQQARVMARQTTSLVPKKKMVLFSLFYFLFCCSAGTTVLSCCWFCAILCDLVCNERNEATKCPPAILFGIITTVYNRICTACPTVFETQPCVFWIDIMIADMLALHSICAFPPSYRA